MSCVRFSTKVVQDCPVCKNEGWVTLLADYPDYLTWHGWLESGDHKAPLPNCCTSCWYIYEFDQGLVLYHAGPHVCKADFEDVTLTDREAGMDWTPPEDCNFPEVALECVREWATEGVTP